MQKYLKFSLENVTNHDIILCSKSFKVNSDYLEGLYNQYVENNGQKQIGFRTLDYRYKLSFDTMVQENELTSKKREIRRRPKKRINER